MGRLSLLNDGSLRSDFDELAEGREVSNLPLYFVALSIQLLELVRHHQLVYQDVTHFIHQGRAQVNYKIVQLSNLSLNSKILSHSDVYIVLDFNFDL